MNEKTPRTLEQLDGSLRKAVDMYEAGVLTDSLYWKCCLLLAHEYMLAGEDTIAWGLVRLCSRAYLNKEALVQASEDGQFADALSFIANKIKAIGVKPKEQVSTWTPKMAQA